MKTLHQLYVSLVRTHLEYAAAVWHPQKDIVTLRNPSNLLPEFALKTGILVITTFWTFLSYLHLHNVDCTQGCALRM